MVPYVTLAHGINKPSLYSGSCDEPQAQKPSKAERPWNNLTVNLDSKWTLWTPLKLPWKSCGRSLKLGWRTPWRLPINWLEGLNHLWNIIEIKLASPVFPWKLSLKKLWIKGKKCFWSCHWSYQGPPWVSQKSTLECPETLLKKLSIHGNPI